MILGSVAPIPLRSEAAEKAIAGKPITMETATAAAEAAIADAKPLSMNGYKVALTRTVVKRALLAAGRQSLLGRGLSHRVRRLRADLKRPRRTHAASDSIKNGPASALRVLAGPSLRRFPKKPRKPHVFFIGCLDSETSPWQSCKHVVSTIMTTRLFPTSVPFVLKGELHDGRQGTQG